MNWAILGLTAFFDLALILAWIFVGRQIEWNKAMKSKAYAFIVYSAVQIQVLAFIEIFPQQAQQLACLLLCTP